MQSARTFAHEISYSGEEKLDFLQQKYIVWNKYNSL